MKHLKKYETFSEESYLHNFDKYFLIRGHSSSDYYHIVENLKIQLKKLYDVLGDNTIEKIKNDFYFSMPEEMLRRRLVYQSNNLEEIFNKCEMIKTSDKYNL